MIKPVFYNGLLKGGTSLVVVLFSGLMLCGCDLDFNKKKDISETGTPEKETVVPWIKGTVAEHSELVGVRMPITGWGLVIGLRNGGSSEIPPTMRRKIEKYLIGQIALIKKHASGRYVSVDRFLRDSDTALVKIKAFVPAGAPKGTKLDVYVEAWPGTQTTTLEGGMLLPIQMHIDYGIGREDLVHSNYATAGGRVFVNPFIDLKKRGSRNKIRKGRILGGATLLKKMPVRLELYNASYMMAKRIRDKINYRFKSGHKDVAVAKTRYYIDVTIPDKWQKDYRRFLTLMQHYPVSAGSSGHKASVIAEEMNKSGANCQELSLVWESLGKEVLPVVQAQYSSSSETVAFYASRTGLRLGDMRIGGKKIVDFAKKDGPFQIAAIKELGEQRNMFYARRILRKLLDAKRATVRVAAYNALRERGDSRAIKTIRVGGENLGSGVPAFELDIVDSSREYVIYARTFESPRIVIFGSAAPVKRPVFYHSWDKALTIYSGGKGADTGVTEEDASAEAGKLMLFRQITLPGGRKVRSELFKTDFMVSSLIKTLGAAPRPALKSGEVEGLGISYGYILRVIDDMCKQKKISAEFYLRDPSDLHNLRFLTTPTISINRDQPAQEP